MIVALLFHHHNNITVLSDPNDYGHLGVNVDSRGIVRGRCSSCACDGYDGGSEKKRCIGCGHPPGKHVNVSTSLVGSTPLVSSSNTAAASNSSTGHSDWAIPKYQCQYPGCQKESDLIPTLVPRMSAVMSIFSMHKCCSRPVIPHLLPLNGQLETPIPVTLLALSPTPAIANRIRVQATGYKVILEDQNQPQPQIHQREVCWQVCSPFQDRRMHQV